MTNHKEDFFKPGISITGAINPFFERGPQGYWKHSSYNPDRVKKASTPEMAFGRLVHNMILTPELAESEFATYPRKEEYPDALDTTEDLKAFLTQANLIGADGKPIRFLSKDKAALIKLAQTVEPRPVLWAEIEQRFFDRVGKRQIVTHDQVKQAESMRDAMFRNSAVCKLLNGGASEQPVTWYREPPEQGGLMCKCQLDYRKNGLVIEYKSTAGTNLENLQRTIGNMGYHRQLAWEEDAATIIDGKRPRGSVIIFQDTELHDDIVIFPLKPSAITIGHQENAFAYEEIKKRLHLWKSGDLGAWRTHEQKILDPIGLPSYYRSPITIQQETTNE